MTAYDRVKLLPEAMSAGARRVKGARWLTSGDVFPQSVKTVYLMIECDRVEFLGCWVKDESHRSFWGQV